LLFYIGGARYRYGPLTYHRFNLDSWERLFGYAAYPVEIHCAPLRNFSFRDHPDVAPLEQDVAD
jgi:hypothetical protein